MLEKAKNKHVVVPAINWLIATLNEAEAFGYTHEKAEKVGYKRELEAAIAGLREMHRRGIVGLPGGDYGFGWTPHGTYARDLEPEGVPAAARGRAGEQQTRHRAGLPRVEGRDAEGVLKITTLVVAV